MIRILICDDEGIVQESLRYIIQRNFSDLCEIQSAKNGRAAIQIAEEFNPDIVLMDIQMPGINGIEAMQAIRKENGNAIFIVLTAYDKFEYTQKSIDIGVMSYLTKPINKDILVDILRKAMNKIKERKEKVTHDLEVKEKLEVIAPMLEGGFIYSVLLGEYKENFGYLQLLNIGTDYGYVIVVECGDEFHKGVLTNTVGAGIRMQKHYMVLREILKEATGGIVGTLMGNKVIAVVPNDSGEEEYNERIQKIDFIRAMVRKFEHLFNMGFKVGIGTIKKWGEIGVSYQEAIDTERQGIGKVTHAKDLPVGCLYEESYPYELEKELFGAVESGEQEKTEELSKKFFLWMRGNSKEITNSVRLKIMEFVLWAEHIAYMQGGLVYHFSSREGYLETVLSFQNYEELGNWFIKKMEEACQHITMRRQEKANNIVEKAKTYISSSLFRDISLEKMAKDIGISPYYLSKLFKESEGVTYIDYVTGLRIDYAKEQLNKSEKSIKEICREAGYKDPNYFSRIFKKWTGVTPTEFRSGGA